MTMTIVHFTFRRIVPAVANCGLSRLTFVAVKQSRKISRVTSLGASNIYNHLAVGTSADIHFSGGAVG